MSDNIKDVIAKNLLFNDKKEQNYPKKTCRKIRC